MVYSAVALNIAEEFGFFNEATYPITVINKPVSVASHQSLQQSLDWQKVINNI
jgi:hypothetical protein